VCSEFSFAIGMLFLSSGGGFISSLTTTLHDRSSALKNIPMPSKGKCDS